MQMKRIGLLAVLFAAVAVRTAAARQPKEDTLVFTPQWMAQAQFAGYYVAEVKGFFQEEGVNVKIVHPSPTQSAVNRLRSNESQAISLQLCQALEMVDAGFPMVNILQTSMNNGMVIVSARGKDPLTQKGAKVGIWSVGFGQLAICMSIKENLNYDWVRFAQNMNLFIAGALDLATGRMLYCNAGHDAPVLVGAGVGELPCDPNIPVGFMPEWVYTLQEAEKALANREQEPRKIIASMTEAVHQFVGEADQSDDLTMMAIQLTL